MWFKVANDTFQTHVYLPCSVSYADIDIRKWWVHYYFTERKGTLTTKRMITCQILKVNRPLNTTNGMFGKVIKVTCRPTKQDFFIKKVRFAATCFFLNVTIIFQSHLKSSKHMYLAQLLPYLFIVVHFTTNLIHQSKTAHHWKELLTPHGKTPIDQMLQKETFKIR